MKRDKLKKASHVIAALIFILLAFYVFETPNIIIAFAAVGLGIVFLLIAGIHDWLTINYKNISLLFIFLEAVFMLGAAYIFFIKQHNALVNLMGVSALVFIIIGIYFLATKKRTRHKHRSRKSSSMHQKILIPVLLMMQHLGEV